MSLCQNLHWQAAQRAACVDWAEVQATVALDQWYAAESRANELAVAEFAAMAGELAVPEFAVGEEVMHAASAEVQVSEPGGVVAQEMLRHFKEMLVLDIPAECVAEAQVLAACTTLDTAVAQYLIMVQSNSCKHLLPKARDMIVSFAAFDIGFTNQRLFMSVVKDAFNSHGPNWTHQEAAQIQNSWAKATTDMRDEWPHIWMSRNAKRKRKNNPELHLADRQSQTGFREPPGLSLPLTRPMIDVQALPELHRGQLRQ